MASVNKVILIGNLGADPELRQLPSGSQVCEFRIATTEQFNDRQGQRQEHTEWHRIVVYGRQAEACAQYLAKGRPCYVEGRIRTRSWEDKRDGSKRYMTEIVADRVQFLGSPGERRGGASATQIGAGRGAPEPVDPGPPDDFGGGPPSGGEDDIPF